MAQEQEQEQDRDVQASAVQVTEDDLRSLTAKLEAFGQTLTPAEGAALAHALAQAAVKPPAAAPAGGDDVEGCSLVVRSRGGSSAHGNRPGDLAAPRSSVVWRARWNGSRTGRSAHRSDGEGVARPRVETDRYERGSGGRPRARSGRCP